MPSSENSERAILDPFEDTEWLAARSILARHGFEPQSPKLLHEQQIRGRLWELIYAMAARRFYLACTDHLSDRELHLWLHENWLDEATADLPPHAEWNTRISPVCDGSEEEGTMIWLRYYADEEEREQFSEDSMPPHEDPAHDRDRFLPDAPTPQVISREDDISTGDDCYHLDEVFDDDDPLGLKAADAAIQFESDDCEAMGFADDLQSIEEKWQQPLKLLRRQGVTLLPPDEHTDETIGAAVWELLHELACRGFYVLHTDHLTDRELYGGLWRDSLREPAMLPGRCHTAAWYHDFTGDGSDEAEQIRLRFYATDEERAKAQAQNPSLSLPPREAPVARRDWRLPKGPF